uniref:Uncharacterized protein n=1 Tax=Ditylenchus dipsaci TaxID=166011 RepID=A0A915ENC2_9BILA
MDLEYQADVDPSWGCLKEAQVWWPYKKGFLRSHNTVPADAPINSSVELRWKMEVGEKMCDPESFAHFLVSAKLLHKDFEAILKDVEWLQTNWKPDVILNQ